MPLSLTTLTGPIYMPNGKTPFNGKVIFEMTSWDQEEGEALILPGPFISEIDDNGLFEVELFTTTQGNQSANYRFYVSWFDSQGAGEYTNTSYNSHGSNNYIKEFIGSFSLSGSGPFSVSELSIVNDLQMTGTFDFYTQMKAMNAQTSEHALTISSTKDKLVNITVTQPVDLDSMVIQLSGLVNGLVAKGDWDASTNIFPDGEFIGWIYNVSVAGTVDGVVFTEGDQLMAIANSASPDTYQGNWSKLDTSDQVTSVGGMIGNITSAQIKSIYESNPNTNPLSDATLETITTKLTQVPFRSTFVDNNGNGVYGGLVEGTQVLVQGLLYVRAANSTSIPDLHGWNAIPTNGVYTLSQFGVTGNGSEGEKLNSALAATADGNRVLIDKAVLTSIQMVWPTTTGGLLNPQKNAIIYDREQTGSGLTLQPLSPLIGIDGAVFDDFEVRYTGTYNTGGAYTGLVHGIYVMDSHNVIFNRGSAQGFNSYGMLIGTLDATNNPLCSGIQVNGFKGTQCRVSAIGFGHTKHLKIRDCHLSYNGLSSDSTGYGFAGNSGFVNEECEITGVTTEGNFGKGWDLHDGGSYQLRNMVSIKDRRFGFDAQTQQHDFTSLILSDFHIVCDPNNNTVANSNYYALEVQINPGNVAGKGLGHPQIHISNGTIEGLGNNVASIAVKPMVVVYGGKTKATVSYSNISVNGTNVDDCIYVTCKSHAAGEILVKHENINYDLVEANTLGVVVGTSYADVTLISKKNNHKIPTVFSWNYTYNAANIDFDNNTLNGEMIESICRMGVGSTRRKKVTKPLTAGVTTDMFIVGNLGTGGRYDVDYSGSRIAGGGGAVRSGTIPIYAGTFSASRQGSAGAVSDFLVSGGGVTLGLTWTVAQVGTQFVVRVVADADCNLTAEMRGVAGIDTTSNVI